MSNTRQELSNPVSSADPVTPVRTGAAARPDKAAPRILRSMLALDDFEAPARRYIPRPIFGYVSGGAETNASMRGNHAAFDDHHACRHAAGASNGGAREGLAFVVQSGREDSSTAASASIA